MGNQDSATVADMLILRLTRLQWGGKDYEILLSVCAPDLTLFVSVGPATCRNWMVGILCSSFENPIALEVMRIGVQRFCDH